MYVPETVYQFKDGDRPAQFARQLESTYPSKQTARQSPGTVTGFDMSKDGRKQAAAGSFRLSLAFIKAKAWRLSVFICIRLQAVRFLDRLGLEERFEVLENANYPQKQDARFKSNNGAATVTMG